MNWVVFIFFHSYRYLVCRGLVLVGTNESLVCVSLVMGVCRFAWCVFLQHLSLLLGKFFFLRICSVIILRISILDYITCKFCNITIWQHYVCVIHGCNCCSLRELQCLLVYDKIWNRFFGRLFLLVYTSK